MFGKPREDLVRRRSQPDFLSRQCCLYVERRGDAGRQHLGHPCWTHAPAHTSRDPQGRTVPGSSAGPGDTRAKCQPRSLSPAGGQREAGSSLCHVGPLQTHLGEEPPPLLAQLEVGGAVPLQDLRGRQLLPLLGQRPVGRGSWSAPPGGGRPTSLPTVLTSLPGFFPELRSSGVTSPRELSPPPQPPPTQQMFQDVWRHFWLSQVGRALLPSGGEKPGLLLKPLSPHMGHKNVIVRGLERISRYRVFRREKVLGTKGRGE